MTALLVCSTGGHLSELHRLAPRMETLEPPYEWVTFDTPQSRALLAGESVTYASYTGQRDLRGVVKNLPLAARMLDRSKIDVVVTTGAAIAASFLPLARARRIPCHYVEGVARTVGPSVTGRMLVPVPGIRFYTQWDAWEGERWHYRGSVFESYSVDAEPATSQPIRKVVVMLGTMLYSFRRLVDRLLQILPPEVEVTWQVGATKVDDLPIEAHVALPPEELDSAIRAADVIVGHAGCGSALQVLDAGKCPVLVPRERAHGEHVDDHQKLIADLLPQLGLAVARPADDLEFDHLLEAASRRISTVGSPPPFRLA